MQTSMKRFPQFVNLFNENLRYAERDFYDSKFSKYKKKHKNDWIESWKLHKPINMWPIIENSAIR